MASSWLDGKVPWHKWIRTEFGWKPLSELLSTHFLSQILQLPGNSRDSSGNHAPINDDTTNMKSSTERIKFLHHALTMRSVSTCDLSSRKSNRYSTTSDAIQKLNFHAALEDNNCFPFICKVLCLIFEKFYHCSSGSLQMTLLTLVEAALVQSINTRMFGSLVYKTIDRAISANQRVRQKQVSTFVAVSNVDRKIKTLLRMKQRLQESERGKGNSSDEGPCIFLLVLPDDCLRHIISFLSNPRDILNLQQSSLRLNDLGTENQVWKSLTHYHYGQEIDDVVIEENSWMDTFSAHYLKSEKRLKPDESNDVIVLCKICKFVYWKHYGHPCCGDSLAADALAGKHMIEFLTPQDFMTLFSF